MSSGARSLGYALVAIVLVVIAYLVATAKESSETATPATSSTSCQAEELMKVTNPKGLREKLITYTGMTVSFNSETHEPNWVAWELLESEVSGDSEREDSFSVDEKISGCATPDDYRHTGFDRGHMAPAGDMKWDPQAMRESFYMTNICPQAADLNRGAWKKLEEKCRLRAEVDSALIIICGPIFDKSGPSARIGGTGVAVPQKFFKVILAPFAATPWAIGFIMPNDYVAGGMQKTAVTVDEVEALTGYDFFAALPDSIENAVEAKCDFNAFSRIPKK
jgi:endonuclease G